MSRQLLTAASSCLTLAFSILKRYDLGKVGRHKLNRKLRLNIPEATRVLTPQDIVAAIDYLINLEFDIGNPDDIDHLGNRRVRSVGELLQNQVRVGLNRLERIIRERMTVSDRRFSDACLFGKPKAISRCHQRVLRL